VTRLAPYVDMGLRPAPDLVKAASGGIRIFNLAFITAASRSCQASWGGGTAYDDASIEQRVRALRAAGADARLSFGGARSRELAQACPSVPALVAAYRTVIDAYDLTLLDFDVEGAAVADREAVRRRNLAVRELQADAQRRGGSLRVSYTLPAAADGLTAPAQELLHDARATGVQVETVNVMTMNFGSGSGDMAERSMTAARGAEAFVRSLWGGPDTGAWGMIALTPMIGVNDTPGEVFRPEDAVRLKDFARDHRLAWLSFWSLNRDRACPGGTPTGTAQPGCSGLDQTPGDFTRIFARYT
jgi:hypothetical protein